LYDQPYSFTILYKSLAATYSVIDTAHVTKKRRPEVLKRFASRLQGRKGERKKKVEQKSIQPTLVMPGFACTTRFQVEADGTTIGLKSALRDQESVNEPSLLMDD